MHESLDIQGGNIGVVRLDTGDKAWTESWCSLMHVSMLDTGSRHLTVFWFMNKVH